MGGFLGIGGSSAKTDRKTTLQGFGDLQNIFNFGMGQSSKLAGEGGTTIGKGVDALTTSLDYFKKLASGDRSVTAQAIAPETNAVQSQADAARRSAVATGTARGGGTASNAQTAQERTMAQIDNFLMGARPMANQEVEKIGGTLGGIGLGETNAALGFGDLAEKGASDLTKEAADSRKTSYEINQDTVKQVTQTISDVIGAFGF